MNAISPRPHVLLALAACLVLAPLAYSVENRADARVDHNTGVIIQHLTVGEDTSVAELVELLQGVAHGNSQGSFDNWVSGLRGSHLAYKAIAADKVIQGIYAPFLQSGLYAGRKRKAVLPLKYDYPKPASLTILRSNKVLSELPAFTQWATGAEYHKANDRPT